MKPSYAGSYAEGMFVGILVGMNVESIYMKISLLLFFGSYAAYCYWPKRTE